MSAKKMKYWTRIKARHYEHRFFPATAARHPRGVFTARKSRTGYWNVSFKRRFTGGGLGMAKTLGKAKTLAEAQGLVKVVTLLYL